MQQNLDNMDIAAHIRYFVKPNIGPQLWQCDDTSYHGVGVNEMDAAQGVFIGIFWPEFSNFREYSPLTFVSGRRWKSPQVFPLTKQPQPSLVSKWRVLSRLCLSVCFWDDNDEVNSYHQ